jgi:hypothetical protein
MVEVRFAIQAPALPGYLTKNHEGMPDICLTVYK